MLSTISSPARNWFSRIFILRVMVLVESLIVSLNFFLLPGVYIRNIIVTERVV